MSVTHDAAGDTGVSGAPPQTDQPAVHEARPGGPTVWADRLAQLLEAQRSLVRDLSLTDVLTRIATAARDISGAQYAALGVLGTDGLLDQFVHVGMHAETVALIGDLPRGRGVLGAVIDDPHPIRLDRISDDPRSSGFPEHHPAMTSFLGVPVRSHDEVYGNLYLTNRVGGPFTDDDEKLITALAGMAGTAVANARLYHQARRRQDWLSASAAISRGLMARDADEATTLQRTADTVLRLAEADLVSIVRPVGRDDLVVTVAAGTFGSTLLGYRYPAAGSLASRSLSTGRGMVIERVTDNEDTPWVHLNTVIPLGTAMIFPLLGEHGPRGAITVGRVQGRQPFDAEQLAMAEAFANQAAVAMELAEARADRQRLQVLDDRDRIARDLHDHVIQRIFASGLTLQGVATAASDPDTAQRLTSVVDDLDAIIRQIRASIFELRETSTQASLRRAVLDVVAELAETATPPAVSFLGPVDTVDEQLFGDVTAAVREGLSNAIRHARAGGITVVLERSGARLSVAVVDDGTGWADSSPTSGLVNLADRARRRGGDLSLDQTPGGGATLRWTIPIS